MGKVCDIGPIYGSMRVTPFYDAEGVGEGWFTGAYDCLNEMSTSISSQ